MNKKVSVITPCYNVEKYIKKFLQSILDQDYLPLELIIVNDGSNDNTESIILDFMPKLESYGIEVKYIFQENAGLAAAINTGLKSVTGEYLIWPDPDDFLLKDSIRKRVDYLEAHPEYGMVRSNGYQFDENYVQLKPVTTMKNEYTIEDFCKFKVAWCPGCYMIRMSDFDAVNKDREIFIIREGQNIQMLLPVASHKKCGYIDEYLYGYLIRGSSLSHSKKSYDKQIEQLNNLETCVKETLSRLNVDTSYYTELIQKFAMKQRYVIAWYNNNKYEMKKFKNILVKNKAMEIDIAIMQIFPNNNITRYIIRVINFLKRRLNICRKAEPKKQ